MKLNKVGYEHARSLISQGKVNTTSGWSWSTEDEDRILGDPPDWDEYKKWFLGRDDEGNEETKGYWHFPYGKEGKVYRSGVIAAKQRAAQHDHGEIRDAADRLLKMIDDKYQWFKMRVNDEEKDLEIVVYDVIGYDVDAAGFVKMLREYKGKFESVTLRVNSPGGSVFDGLAMYNVLRSLQKPIKVYVDGIAASAATLLTSAGHVIIPKNAVMMVHDPTALVAGTAEDMKKVAGVLETLKKGIINVYKAKTGLDEDELWNLMKDETWMDAEQAVELGFADELVDAVSITDVHVNYDQYRNVKGGKQMGTLMAFIQQVLDRHGVQVDLPEIEGELDRDILGEFVSDGNEPQDAPQLDPQVQAELESYRQKVDALERAILVKDLSGKVGEDNAMLLAKIKGSVSEEVFNDLVARFEGFTKVINELGSAKGDGTPKEPSLSTEDKIMKKAQEIADEMKVSLGDALVELAKREPELVAQWK